MNTKIKSIWNKVRGLVAHPTIRVKLDEGAILPERAHDTDAGADIFAPHDVTVPGCEVLRTPMGDYLLSCGCAVIHTGVHVELPHNTVGMLKSKSGLNRDHDIIGEGVIDQGYDGEIVVKLYNLGPVSKTLPRGSKIIQLVVMPVLYPTYVEAEQIEAGERGSDGFGSTGA